MTAVAQIKDIAIKAHVSVKTVTPVITAKINYALINAQITVNAIKVNVNVHSDSMALIVLNLYALITALVLITGNAQVLHFSNVFATKSRIAIAFSTYTLSIIRAIPFT